MKFVLYWLSGSHEVVEGNDVADAVSRAGYGAGAMRALDFYEEGEEPSYSWSEGKWSKDNDKFERLVQFIRLSFDPDGERDFWVTEKDNSLVIGFRGYTPRPDMDGIVFIDDHTYLRIDKWLGSLPDDAVPEELQEFAEDYWATIQELLWTEDYKGLPSGKAQAATDKIEKRMRVLEMEMQRLQKQQIDIESADEVVQTLGDLNCPVAQSVSKYLRKQNYEDIL